MPYLPYIGSGVFTVALGWASGFVPQFVYKKDMQQLTSSYVNNPLQPPGYVFGIVWTTLYFLMGVAILNLWFAPASVGLSIFVKWFLIAWFFLQLGLNLAWTWIYYVLPLFQSVWATITLAILVFMMLLVCLLASCINLYSAISPFNYIIAAACTVPYLTWTVFASALHLNSVFLNPGK